MNRVSLSELSPDSVGERSDVTRLDPAIGTSSVAVNRYRIAPGDELPGGLHAHLDQEEIFVVLQGTATFETYPPLGATASNDESVEAPVGPGRTRGDVVSVGGGESIRFAPGEFQSGRNDGTQRLVAVALGAPMGSNDVRLPLPCPTCRERGIRLETDRDVPGFECPHCGATHTPANCPNCGGDDLRSSLGPDGIPVVACRDCAKTYVTPPVVE